MNIHGKIVRLRAIEPEDLPLLQHWGNDPTIQRLLGGWHFPTSTVDQRAWLASLNCQSSDQRWAVELPEVGLVGTANLVAIDWKNRTAFHGMLLGNREHQQRGLGRDTIMAVMRYAFDELGLEHLDGDMIEYNSASLKTYVERCGWQIQGRKPAWYYREGRRWDKIIVGISAAQYRALAERIGYWAVP
jgi:RimJ/RimL family protein N-acetyltransferase